MIDLQVIEDTWLSEILGVRCGKILQGPINAENNNLGFNDLVDYQFLSARLKAEATKDFFLLQSWGFYFVETTLTFQQKIIAQRKPQKLNPNILIRLARRSDYSDVHLIAERSFSLSRFHVDQNISNKKANKIKVDWACNYFKGNRGDLMLVAENKGRVVGFLQIIFSKNSDILIDLIATDPEMKQVGIGTKLISNLTNFFDDNFSLQASIYVSTQAANFASVSLYKKMGFELSCTQHVFHFYQS